MRRVSDVIATGRAAYLCHRGGPALDGAITPRVRIRRGLGHVSLASENSTR